MSSSDSVVPVQVWAPPGSIEVTERALNRAKRFELAAPDVRIIAFSWYEASRMRTSEDAPWANLGPGIDLVAYDVGAIPIEAIWHNGPFRYAVLIPREIIAGLARKTLDLDERGKPILV